MRFSTLTTVCRSPLNLSSDVCRPNISLLGSLVKCRGTKRRIWKAKSVIVGDVYDFKTLFWVYVNENLANIKPNGNSMYFYQLHIVTMWFYFYLIKL